MGKKSVNKQNDRIIAQILEEDRKIRSEYEKFYPDGVLANFLFVVGPAPPPSLISCVKEAAKLQTTEQRLFRDCCQITRNNVQQGKPGSFEIQFNKGRQRSNNHDLQLGNTAVRFLPCNASEQLYLFLKAGDTLDACIFLDGNQTAGTMLIKDENGDDFFLGLSEFHMLSIVDNPDPRKEVGLMTSFTLMAPKVYSSVICAPSLDPIKNLLFSEWLLKRWEFVNNVTTQSPDVVIGGDVNEPEFQKKE